MTARIKLRWLLALAVLLAAGSAFGGAQFGRHFERNWLCCQVPAPRRIALSLQDVLGLGGITSDRGQDRWVQEAVFPGVTDGFFLDVGSGDGVSVSNTLSLERRGWTGVCIDAFPRNMRGRTCQVFGEVVDRVAGRRVTFWQAGDLGGIGEYLGHARSDVEQFEPVELVTTTLADILVRAKAPAYVHFMSLDIEGAEVAALDGFPFDKHQLGSIVVEHNFEEPKRAELQALLGRHGYERVHSWQTDDFYRPRTARLPRR